MKTPIQTRDAPEAIGTYSQAVRAGDTVYLSGQIGLDPATMQMAEGIEAQTHRVFRNLAAVAAAAGLEPGPRRAHDRLPHRPRAFRARERDHGAVRARALSRRAPRSASPACRAARWSRSTRSCTPIKASLDKKLAKLGLRSRFDLVLHLPLRYEDETVAHRAARPRPAGTPVCVEAPVLKAQVMYRPKRQLVVHAEGLVLRFFNFYRSQLKQFQRAADAGLLVRAFGEVRRGFFGAEMVHPRYRIVRRGRAAARRR